MINKEIYNKIYNKNEIYIEKHFYEIYHLIKNYLDINISWKQKLYLYQNNLTSIPKCYCGKENNFINSNKGYYTYCSTKCQSNSIEITNKRNNTNMEKYGGNPMYSEAVKLKLNNTIIEKYGVDNISKLQEVKNKVKQTNFNKTGFEYNSQRPEVKDVLRKSLNENLSKIQNIKKNNDYNILYEKCEKLNLILINSDKSVYEIKCNLCDNNFNITKNTLNDRIKNKNTICTICNSINNSSNYQDQLIDFINNNIETTIIKNTRSVINGELDIYLPELNIAFEFNGVYWHSDIFKDKDYHSNKTNKCLEKNIHLIHIWEDDWYNKKEIILSRILNILGKSERIYARNCIIKEIDSKTYKKFLENNHLQGNVSSKIKIGLFYNNDMVSVMSFGSFRLHMGKKHIDNHYELLRFCNKLNLTVIGGASKLLNYFINKYNPTEIISYADRCWSIGNLYTKLGFKNTGISKPNFFYVKNNIRYNRFSYRKSILVKNGEDPNLTGEKIMMKNGFYKIYNSGNYKFTLKLK